MVLRGIFRCALIIGCLLVPVMSQAQTAEAKQYTDIELFTLKAIEELESTAPKLEQLFDKGVARQEQKDFFRAKESFTEFLNLLKKHLQVVCTLLCEEDQQTYMQVYMPWVEHIKHCGVFYADNDPLWGDLVYDCELFSKSLFLESVNRLRFAVLKSGDEKLINLWKLHEELKSDYSTYKSYMAILESDSTFLAAQKAYLQGVDHQLTDEVRRAEKVAQSMAKLKEAVRSTEEDLNQMIAISHDPQINFTTSWSDIRNSLSNDQAAVEFISHSFANTPEEVQYTAIITRSDSKHPQIVHLLNEAKLCQLLEKHPQDFDSLYHVIWQPIEAHFNGVREIFISASGMMSGVSFAALRHENSSLSDYVSIRNVVSTKDIIALSNTSHNPLPSHGSAIFFGGADFGMVSDTSVMQNKTRGQGFDYLPGSKSEVLFSSVSLENKGWKISLFTDESASEEQLKKSLSDSSATILHIATHGFNLPEPDRRVFDMTMKDIGSIDKAFFRFSRDPLIRCGLLFSGANRVWRGKEAIEGVDDGIVTGMDVSKLNLLGCELAIISACYTALGGIDHSEGIYGLQRALRIAGARRMILSLWNIPDKESAEFMQTFYTFLISDIPINDAFRATQKTMRTLYPNKPNKWAGFVMIE